MIYSPNMPLGRNFRKPVLSTCFLIIIGLIVSVAPTQALSPYTSYLSKVPPTFFNIHLFKSNPVKSRIVKLRFFNQKILKKKHGAFLVLPFQIYSSSFVNGVNFENLFLNQTSLFFFSNKAPPLPHFVFLV